MPKINPASKRTARTRRTTDFDYTPSFDSQIPTGWKHRNTKWYVLNQTMNELLDGTHDNARFDVTSSKDGDTAKAINSIRGAIYRWSVNAEIDTTKYKVRTASGLTDEKVPYLVAWIEEV